MTASRILRRAAAIPAAVFICLGAALTSPARTWALTPAEDFTQTCANCHTIGGGRLTGPDLKNVGQRRSGEWLLKMVPDPKRMLDGGDSTFTELYKDYRGVLMPTLPGMTQARVEALLKLIDDESKLAKSRFAGAALISRPLLPSDIADGAAIFLGTTRLKNGGPACLSCHSVGGMSGLGGGRLGPDLSQAFAKLGGEKALASWLAAPASPTMQPVYAGRTIDPEEILPLVAYLKDAAQKGIGADSTPRLAFLIIGLAVAAGMFAGLDAIWRRRFVSARRALINKSHAEAADAR